MRNRIALSIVPTLAFLAADKDALGGSTDSEKPKTLTDALTALAKAEADGKAAADLLAEANANVEKLTQAWDDSQAEVTRLAGQFAELEKTAKQSAADLVTAQAAIKQITLERDAAQGNLTTERANISRLEALCGVKGIDPSKAIAVEAEAPANKTLTRAAFDKLSYPERNAFFRNGGKLTE